MSIRFPVVQAPILLEARRCCCASREVLEGMALGLNLASHRLQLPLRNSPCLYKEVQPRATQEPTFGTPVSVPRVFLEARRKERSVLQRAASLQPQRCSWLTSLFSQPDLLRPRAFQVCQLRPFLRVGGSFSARVPRSSALLHRDFSDHILEDEVDRQDEEQGDQRDDGKEGEVNGVVEGNQRDTQQCA